MRTLKPAVEAEQVRHLAEPFLHQVAKGKEWATPGVQVALQRAVAGLDAGIDSASPRLQALLRHLADELADGVETLTPRVQEQLKHLRTGTSNQVVETAPVKTRSPFAMLWWSIGLAVLAGGGVAIWRSRQAAKAEPATSLTEREPPATDPDTDPDLAAGRM